MAVRAGVLLLASVALPALVSCQGQDALWRGSSTGALPYFRQLAVPTNGDARFGRYRAPGVRQPEPSGASKAITAIKRSLESLRQIPDDVFNFMRYKALVWGLPLRLMQKALEYLRIALLGLIDDVSGILLLPMKVRVVSTVYTPFAYIIRALRFIATSIVNAITMLLIGAVHITRTIVVRSISAVKSIVEGLLNLLTKILNNLTPA